MASRPWPGAALSPNPQELPELILFWGTQRDSPWQVLAASAQVCLEPRDDLSYSSLSVSLGV